MTNVIPLPWPFRRPLESAAAGLLRSDAVRVVDFTRPPGEPALAAPDSVSWRIFKNPISLFIGGVAAVVLELAEPRIRSAIWEHSSYRRDPLRRLRRTGLAAMITVYGARSVAEPMIASVAGVHARVSGTTPKGVAYSAADPALLTWVHATAAFGFVEAYHRFVERLGEGDLDAYFAEGGPAARLYGSPEPPRTAAEIQALFARWRPTLEPSPIIGEFLDLMGETPALPRPLQPLQRLLVRAAVDILPEELQRRLGLGTDRRLSAPERWMVSAAAKFADRILLEESPAVQSCVRLGLPVRYLYDR